MQRRTVTTYVSPLSQQSAETKPPRGPWTRFSHATADKTALHNKQAALIAPDRSRAGDTTRSKAQEHKKKTPAWLRVKEPGKTQKNVDISAFPSCGGRCLAWIGCGAAPPWISQYCWNYRKHLAARLYYLWICHQKFEQLVCTEVTKDRCLLNGTVTYWQNIPRKITLSCIDFE